MHRHRVHDHDHAIVLAGGSGTRLAALARDAGGVPVPKQYCSLRGGRSLLGDALLRAEGVVPSTQVTVVVAAAHERFWRPELADRPAKNIIVQPQNRGTAAGILLPLMTILERDPAARIVLLPADHFVAREPVLTQALAAALHGPDVRSGRVVVLGMQPDAAEREYGWVRPGPPAGATRTVLEFAEKPDAAATLALARAGAVWNSFLLVAAGRALLGLLARRLPALLDAFQGARVGQQAGADLRALYERIEPADFSRDVLQGGEPFLRLQVVPACGWTDLGTPARVQQCLAALRPQRAPDRVRAIADLATLLAAGLAIGT